MHENNIGGISQIKTKQNKTPQLRFLKTGVSWSGGKGKEEEKRKEGEREKEEKEEEREAADKK